MKGAICMKMNYMKDKTPPQAFGQKEISLSVHLVFCILAVIVIYTSVNAYAKLITNGEDEEIAGASIFLFLGGMRRRSGGVSRKDAG